MSTGDSSGRARTYDIFGQVTDGLPALAELQKGDKILWVAVLADCPGALSRRAAHRRKPVSAGTDPGRSSRPRATATTIAAAATVLRGSRLAPVEVLHAHLEWDLPLADLEQVSPCGLFVAPLWIRCGYCANQYSLTLQHAISYVMIATTYRCIRETGPPPTGRTRSLKEVPVDEGRDSGGDGRPRQAALLGQRCERDPLERSRHVDDLRGSRPGDPEADRRQPPTLYVQGHPGAACPPRNSCAGMGSTSPGPAT